MQGIAALRQSSAETETLNFLLESLPSEACWLQKTQGAPCGEHQADIPRSCLSLPAFPAVPQAAAASVGKSPSPECLKPERSQSPCCATIPSSWALQGDIVLAPQALPGHSHSPGCPGPSLHHGLTMQHFFSSEDAFPRFVCCSNADNCNAMQKPQVLKAAHFCFSDVNWSSLQRCFKCVAQLGKLGIQQDLSEVIKVGGDSGLGSG